MTFAPNTAWSNLYMGTKSPKLFSILVSSDITSMDFAGKVFTPRQRPLYYHTDTTIPASGSIAPGLIVSQESLFCGKDKGAPDNCYWYMGDTCGNFIPVSFTSPLVSGTQSVPGYYSIPTDPPNTPSSTVENFYAYIKTGTNITIPSTVKSGNATYDSNPAYENIPVTENMPFFIQNNDPNKNYMTGALSVNYSVDIASSSFQLYEGDFNLTSWFNDVSSSTYMPNIVKSYLINSVYISAILTEFYNQLYFQGFYTTGATSWMYFSQTNPMTDPIGVMNNFTKQYIFTLNIPNMNAQNSIVNNMMIIPEITITNEQCSIKMLPS